MVPKPPVVPVVPHPPAPVPPPKPVDPVPPPKPVDPVPEPPKPAVPVPKPETPRISDEDNICKRGDKISGSKCALPLSSDSLTAFGVKGQEDQASLLKIQRDPNALDVQRNFIGDKYEYQLMADQRNPVNADEMAFLGDSKISLPGWIKSDSWVLSKISNPEKINKKLERDILQTYENPQERAIIVHESFGQERDLVPEAEKARWSDMIMYNWKKACERTGTAPDTLNYILRESIRSGDSATRTKELIDAAIKKVDGKREEVNVFRSGTTNVVGSPAERTAFEMLAGSDHVNRVLKMLADYPQTMRNVRIDSLSVTTSDTKTSEDEYNILIKLVKVSTP